MKNDTSARPLIPGPFRVTCLHCGAAAESWHRDFPAPEGATIGMAYCQCGEVGADSMGFIGYGRVLARSPDSYRIETEISERPE